MTPDKQTEKPKKRRKIRATIVPDGVDIIDANGEWLAGISDSDAIHLILSLRRLLPKIKARLL